MVGCGLALTAGAQAPTVSFDAEKAWGHLITQCDFGPRVPNTEAHRKCRDYLVAEMKKQVDEVRLQEFSYHWRSGGKTLDMANVLGFQNWKDAKIRVVLLAHWDTRPTSDQDPAEANRKKPLIGANDGASGVAVLLELMRAVKGRLPKEVGVLYLLTDGEDVGPGLDEMFVGAKQFMRELPQPKPDYGILLDMVGDRDLRIPMEPNSDRHAPDLLRAFYRHAASVGLASTFPAVFGETIEDDHIPLNRGGIPTIDLIDFDYAPWHTQADVPSACSPASLKKVGTVLETWLLKNPPYSPKGRSG